MPRSPSSSSPGSLIIARRIIIIILLLSLSSRVLSITPSPKDDMACADCFAWARQHGATIDENIEMRPTDYGGRGIFAKADIPADTELIRLPNDLQLGVRQLAEGNDGEMQAMARNLNWKYILEQGLEFVPLSIALCAERRKGPSSTFAPFLDSLSTLQTHSLATPGDDDNHYADDDLNNLKVWSPNVAQKILQRRNGIQAIHQQQLPSPSSSLALEELIWAATNVCSRSLLRRNSPTLSAEQTRRIGEFVAYDRSRMLPIIDLVNHGSLHRANVWVGHLSSGDGHGGGTNTNANNEDEDGDSNDYSTSMKSKRAIKAGEELLFDYGDDTERISNDRLLLDYGFVLPGHAQVTLTLDEFVPALIALDDQMKVGMDEISKEEREGLDAFVKFLLGQASGVLTFRSDGRPTVQSLAVAIALTCRGQDDVTRVLQPVRSNPKDGSLLPAEVFDSCTEAQREFALGALRRAAAVALAQRPTVNSDTCDSNEGDSFAKVARQHATMCRELLLKAVE